MTFHTSPACATRALNALARIPESQLPALARQALFDRISALQDITIICVKGQWIILDCGNAETIEEYAAHFAPARKGA